MLFYGKDPKEEIHKLRNHEAALIHERKQRKTFKETCEAALEVKIYTWKNPDKQVLRWQKSLFERCEFLLDRPVETITTADVVRALKPLWTVQHDTADRMRKHIEFVMSHAIAHKWHSGPNPARWDMNIEHILLKPRQLKKHYAAMHYDVRAIANLSLIFQISYFSRSLRNVNPAPGRLGMRIFPCLTSIVSLNNGLNQSICSTLIQLATEPAIDKL